MKKLPLGSCLTAALALFVAGASAAFAADQVIKIGVELRNPGQINDIQQIKMRYLC